MRAIVIPAGPFEAIHTVDVDGLASLQAQVGGMIELIRVSERDDLSVFVNEEGKYTCDRNEVATEIFGDRLFAGDWIAGDMLVAGFRARDGGTVDLPGDVTVEAVHRTEGAVLR